jgi:flagellar assembly protein FliH
MAAGIQSSEPGKGERGRIESFEYPHTPYAPGTPSWYGMEETGEQDSTQDEPQIAPEHLSSAAFDALLAEEKLRSFESGRERGRQEGRQAEHEAQAVALKTAEEQLIRKGAEMAAAFTQERDRFLHAVEQEVVRLALAIAARILRREAQMDPLLLTGAVRVALGQLSASTEVRLLVPAAELELWTEAIALMPNLPLKPKVLPGEGMHTGECTIETTLGSVDLGIRSQLGEIERGFFDRAGSPRNSIPAGVSAARDDVVEARR